MIYFARFFLGGVVIVVLSFSGCATPTGTGESIVFGSNRPERASPDDNPGLSVVSGDHSWFK
jgi:hypothetical protein